MFTRFNSCSLLLKYSPMFETPLFASTCPYITISGLSALLPSSFIELSINALSNALTYSISISTSSSVNFVTFRVLYTQVCSNVPLVMISLWINLILTKLLKVMLSLKLRLSCYVYVFCFRLRNAKIYSIAWALIKRSAEALGACIIASTITLYK